MCMSSSTCYHCGDSCERSAVIFDEKEFCCNGCKTVYEIFQSSGLEELGCKGWCVCSKLEDLWATLIRRSWPGVTQAHSSYVAYGCQWHQCSALRVNDTPRRRSGLRVKSRFLCCTAYLRKRESNQRLTFSSRRPAQKVQSS